MTPTRPLPGKIGPNDPAKWLCRRRNGWWWIWRPKEYLPVVQLPTFEAARTWRPPDGAYVPPPGYDARHEENVWRARHGMEQL